MSFDLVISDIHTHPDDDFKRLEALGNLILEEKPNNIIILGDGSRHDAFSSYEKYKDWTAKQETDAWLHALSLIFGPMDRWNERQRGHRHRTYSPIKLYVKGNHEDRLNRAISEDKYGYSSLVDLDHVFGKRYFDGVFEYGDVVTVNNIAYTHVPRNKMGRAMAWGTAVKHASSHLIFGHTHSLKVETVPSITSGNAVKMILNAPAFMPMGNKEPYSERLTTGWVYGLVMVYPNGPTDAFGFEYIPTNVVESSYL